jgi:amino acid transporter
LINYFGIKVFGEFEFYLSSIKVIVLLGLIILSVVLACGRGPNHETVGFKYWNNPGAFATYIVGGAAGRFLAVWSTFTTAVFAFLGTELVGVTVGECSNPSKVIPRAIRLTFYRILFFYVILVLLLGMIIPYNNPSLVASTSKGTSAAASPFVVAIQFSGIQTLPAIFNACVLVFVFSAANSGRFTPYDFFGDIS